MEGLCARGRLSLFQRILPYSFLTHLQHTHQTSRWRGEEHTDCNLEEVTVTTSPSSAVPSSYDIAIEVVVLD